MGTPIMVTPIIITLVMVTPALDKVMQDLLIMAMDISCNTHQLKVIVRQFMMITDTAVTDI